MEFYAALTSPLKRILPLRLLRVPTSLCSLEAIYILFPKGSLLSQSKSEWLRLVNRWLYSLNYNRANTHSNCG